MSIGVKCTFQPDGRVQVQAVLKNEQWVPVGQGRQWVDDAGRHVLIEMAGGQIRELILDAQTMCWSIRPINSPNRHIV